MKLKCAICGKRYPFDKKFQRCDCGGPLQLEHLEGEVKEGDIWSRYREYLPYEIFDEISLGEGSTPCIKAEKLSDKYEVDLYLKNETLNPTWSFKDRGTVMGVRRAIDLDFVKIGTVSTGNMAVSVAAYGAHCHLDTRVMVPDTIDEYKMDQISVYGPEIKKVEGDYGKLYYDSLEIGEKEGVYFINSDDPFRIEGYKTISFELSEQVDADHVLIPTSSGGLFRGIVKGYEELFDTGIIEDMPNFTAVQASGCSPVCRAFERDNEIEHWDAPETIAKAIANPLPPSGDAVVKKLLEINGKCSVVDDREIFSAIKDIAREGIYCQPASSIGVAALEPLLEDEIDKGDTVVTIITGSGMKTGNIV